MAAKAVPMSRASVLLPVPPFCEATLILMAIHTSVLLQHDIMRACGHVKGVQRAWRWCAARRRSRVRLSSRRPALEQPECGVFLAGACQHAGMIGGGAGKVALSPT